MTNSETLVSTVRRISVFDLFSIGIGPSSSHTVGPMRAALRFVGVLRELCVPVARVRVELYGSLALTGLGHGTDKAILLGLSGFRPEHVDPDLVSGVLSTVRARRDILIGGEGPRFLFDERRDLVFHRDTTLPFHPNGLRFTAVAGDGSVLCERVYYSVGGGFVVDADGRARDEEEDGDTESPHAFTTTAELLERCRERGLRIFDLVMENEKAVCAEAAVRAGILRLWDVMQACVARGLVNEGTLPGGLETTRRAPALHRQLLAAERTGGDPALVLDWVSLFALAVSEENASGGRVVTAPTNGAAGVVPAVLHYYQRFVTDYSEEGVIRFFLTASAIGTLYKLGASLSAAEMGCQGEIGVACSMAAAGLTAALGGTDAQIENAAEIGMEHNLGLTCDPIGGLVQVPCIERNTMGAVKALNAARLALRGDGQHRVSLDQVIRAMRQTGRDMNTRYKETASGGLAAQVSIVIPEC
jgi:L-serine dehydratase